MFQNPVPTRASASRADAEAITDRQTDPAGCDRDAVTTLAAKFDDAKRPRIVLERLGAAAPPSFASYRNVRRSDGDSPRKIQLGMAESQLEISTR